MSITSLFAISNARKETSSDINCTPKMKTNGIVKLVFMALRCLKRVPNNLAVQMINHILLRRIACLPACLVFSCAGNSRQDVSTAESIITLQLCLERRVKITHQFTLIAET